MSRAVARSICLGLAGTLAVAIATVSLAPTVPAASAEGCAWKRHAKPIVKKVRRQGRLRRVKRIKHWWTCEARPVRSSPVVIPPVLPPPSTPPAEEPQPQAYLGVKAVEYNYTLSRPEVDAGEVTIELNNQGEDPHNLILEREGSADPALEIPSTPSLSQVNARFTLSPGTYLLYCSLYKHDAKGMQATLVVGAK